MIRRVVSRPSSMAAWSCRTVSSSSSKSDIGCPAGGGVSVGGSSRRQADAAAPKASGTLAAHYAPSARVRLLDAEALALRLATAAASGGLEGVAVYSRARLPAWRWQAQPGDPAAAAHELFAVLRQLDSAGAREIWVEAPPRDPAWDGVRDRLSRAAAAFTD